MIAGDLSERQEVVAEVAGEPMEFRLREKQRQVRRPLTPKEKLWCSTGAKGTVVKRTSAARHRDESFPGQRTEWLESAKAPMEALLPLLTEKLRRGVHRSTQRSRGARAPIQAGSSSSVLGLPTSARRPLHDQPAVWLVRSRPNLSIR